MELVLSSLEAAMDPVPGAAPGVGEEQVYSSQAVCELHEVTHPRYQEQMAPSWHRRVPEAGCLFFPQHILSSGCNPIWGYFGHTWGFALAVVYSQQANTACTIEN